MSKLFFTRDAINNFLKNPLLNGWGFIIGIIGFIFALYTWWDGRSVPNLTANAHSIRTILVSPQGVDSLQIFHDGKLVKGPVTALQIALWNSGNKAIKAEDILEPIVLRSNPRTQILSVRVLRSTRDLIGLKVDDSKIHEGSFGITFRVLEKGGGVLLQVTYLGEETHSFTGSGAILGQPTFKVIEFKRIDEGRRISVRAPVPDWFRFITGMLMIVAVILFAFMLFKFAIEISFGTYYRLQKAKAESKPMWHIARIIGEALLSLVLLVGILAFAISQFEIERLLSGSPPFPFQ